MIADAVAVLMPRMKALDDEREVDKVRKEAEAREKARREAESELSRKQHLVQNFTADLLVIPTEGDSRSVSLATLLNDDREVERAMTALDQGGRVACRSAVSLGADGDLHYAKEDLAKPSLGRLVQRVREEGVLKAGEHTWPVRALADDGLLRLLDDRREAGDALTLEVMLDGRVVAKRNADSGVLLKLHRELHKSNTLETSVEVNGEADDQAGKIEEGQAGEAGPACRTAQGGVGEVGDALQAGEVLRRAGGDRARTRKGGPGGRPRRGMGPNDRPGGGYAADNPSTYPRAGCR